MKKVFMSVAIAAMCICAASCGNNTNKAAEEQTCTECTACCDSCACCKQDSTAVEVVEAVADTVVAVAEEIAK